MPESPGEKGLNARVAALEAEIERLQSANAVLQADKRRFQTIFNSMKEVYFEVDLKGDMIYFNPALCTLMGYTPKELMGMNNRQYAPPDTARRMYQIFNRIYQTGEPAEITDYKILNKKGEIRTLELSAYLVADEAGHSAGFCGIGRDVTSRIEAETKLLESEDRFRQLNEFSFSGIFIHQQGIVRECNAELCRMTGYNRDEIIGRDGIRLCVPEFRNQVIKKIQTDDEQAYEIAILRKDGDRLPVEIHARNIAYQGSRARVVELRDISAYRKTEDALKKSRLRYRKLYNEAHKAEELYQSLLNSSADAIMLLDIESKVQFVNPAFTKIFGWTLPEMGASRIQYVPRPLKQSFADLLEKILDLDHPIHGFETQRYTKDGRLLDVSISASRYLDHAGDVTGILLILRDISDMKRYHYHMAQAQKMESLGTLAGGIAHDFNNLLMGIQGRLSLLLLNKDDQYPEYKHLKEIEDYILRAADLTRQMLGIARSGKYEVTPTDMNELIRNQNRLFGRTRKEIIIHESFAEDLFTAEVDQRQIDQVLLNIYVNASHAMPQGGDLYVRTVNEVLSAEMTGPYNVEPGKYIKISITDTGIGMDKATAKRVFEPFFSTKERGRGTGLGLASAYGIIKNHDGFITVYSEKGNGTTLNLYLPASVMEAEKKQLINDEIQEGSGTVLLVDDEEIILSVAEEMIQTLGYNVLTAANGQAAIATYEAEKDTIGLVVLDLIMPGMGGGDVFDRLKAIDPDVKVLLSSGYSIDGQAAAIMKRGCRGFIQKPFSIQELSQKIGQIMASDAAN